jgi:hypothetical protein
MQNHEDNLAGRIGGLIRPLQGVSITVVDSNGQPALLYQADGATALVQPLVTDANGYYGFYAPNGRYTLSFTGSLIDTFTRSVELYDVDDAQPVTAAQLAATSGAGTIGATGGKTVQQEINDLHTWDAAHVLTPATASALGGVKVGPGMTITPDGTLSPTGIGVTSVNGVSADGAGNIALNTDNLPESGTPTNQWFTAARVRAVVLTGLSVATNAVIAATDSVLVALGKLQAQVTANTTAISGKQDASAKDASGGFVGMTGFSHNLKNAAGSIVSAIASAATVSRTWTFPDKSGTVAMTSDISGATPALTQYFESANQTITVGGSLTIAHGMGVAPKVLLAFLKCTTADIGYAVGDIVPIGFNVVETNNRSVTITSNATNLIALFGSNLQLMRKDTGVVNTITNANWAFIVRALA